MRNLSLLVAASLISAVVAQQEAILPASSYFSNTGSSGLTWRTTAFRFQMVYDTTHFTAQGATGPITISRLRFRANGGVVNAGGAVYGTVNVQLSSCPLDYAALVTAFASNRGVDNTTCFTGSVTTLAAAGTTPNTYVIDIPLTTPFVYDPTLGLDLCVEVDATAPVPTTGVPTMATTSVLAQGARRNSASSTTATTGALSTFGSELLIDFTGPGGYTSWGRAGNTVQGVGCYTTARSFYESFPGTEPVSSNDLSNTTVTMLQNGNGGYTAVTTTGATVVPPTGAGLAMLDDSESAAQLLPFTFDYPGGSTTSIVVGSNGYITLNGATSGSIVLGGIPMASELLTRLSVSTAGRHILAASLQDLEPDGALNVDNVFANVDPNNPNIFLITWQNVNCWHATTQPTPARSTFQIALIDGGAADSVEFRYQTLVNDSSNLSGEAATGFSLGSGSTDPGNSDLTAGPVTTGAPEQAGLAMTSTAPLIGSTLTHTVSNIPATALISARLIGFTPVPGVDLGMFGAAGCKQWVDSTTAASELIFTNPTGTANLNIPYIPGLLGAPLYAQGASLVPGVNTLGLLTTNGNSLTVGNSN